MSTTLTSSSFSSLFRSIAITATALGAGYTLYRRWSRGAHRRSSETMLRIRIDDMDAYRADEGVRFDNVRFCLDDTVALRDHMEMMGVVERTHTDVDSHDPDPQRDYDEAIEYDDDISLAQFNLFLRDGVPPSGSALIAMQTEQRTVLMPESKLALLDRHLLVGDIVRKTAESPMSGTVTASKMECTVVDLGFEPTDATEEERVLERAAFVPGVSASELKLPDEMNIGDIILYQHWIGRVTNIEDEVTVGLSNASAVVVKRPEELESAAFSAPMDRLCVGDIVKTKKANLRQGRWKFGAYNPNIPPLGKVVDVRPIQAIVDWRLPCPGLDPSESITIIHTDPPPEVLGADELDSGDIQIYDRGRLPRDTANNALRARFPPAFQVGQRVRFKDIDAAAAKYAVRKKDRRSNQGYDLNVFVIVSTFKRLIVQWQDGTSSEHLSTDLVPDPYYDDDNETWPGDVVCIKDKKDDSTEDGAIHGDYVESSKVGVVQTVNPVDRIASVKWCPDANIKVFDDVLLAGSVIPPAEGSTEDISVYEFTAMDAFNHRRTDMVLVKPEGLKAEFGFKKEGTQGKTSWLGEVVDLGLDGMVTVRLGLLAEPQDIRLPVHLVLLASELRDGLDNGDDMLSEHWSETDEEDDDNMSDIMSDIEDAEPVYEINYDGGERMDQDSEDAWSTEDEAEAESDENMADTPMTDMKASISPQPRAERNVPDSQAPEATTPSITEKLNDSANPSTNIPPRFAILDTEPPPDHHWLSLPASGPLRSMSKISKEHKILRDSLPDGIYVRTWESRLDLFRILLIGPEGTPYEFAPFVIDIRLHSRYPTSPPEVFFHSWTDGQGPINPNLYEDGKICLSLLGTWQGESSEAWTPGRSTLLQIIVSIIGLVLVKEPFYNEAGYEVRIGTAESQLPSRLYSERVYFRSRYFIIRALRGVDGLDDVLSWLYFASSPQTQNPGSTASPRLLERAIDAASNIITRSEGDPSSDENAEGWRITKGAVIPLKRQVEALKSLRKTES